MRNWRCLVCVTLDGDTSVASTPLPAVLSLGPWFEDSNEGP